MPFWDTKSFIIIAAVLVPLAIFSNYVTVFLWGTNITLTQETSNLGESEQSWKNATSIYDFKANDIDGNEVSLEKYRGQVCLIVNIASKCGLTDKNYAQLQQLYDKYSSKGLCILAFPCNQFAGQEPGSNPEICEFVKKFKVTFDMFSKIEVNGDNAHPLWKYLKDKQHGTLGNFIKWNFTKFLVDKNGQPVKRYAPNVDPDDIEPDLQKYLE